jgi:tetratricopeptide (TPR) repeat protein
MQARLLVLGAALASGCVPASHLPVTTAADGPIKIASDDDLTAVRARFDTLPVGDPRRNSLRSTMIDWTLGTARRDLAAHRPDSAFESFRIRTLPLWDSDELTAPLAEPRLAEVAVELERSFQRRGAHRESLTALAVELAVHPDDQAARTRWGLIIDWIRTTPGESSEESTGACDDGCSRAIADLEAVAEVWSSPFVVDELSRLYALRRKPAPEGHHAAGISGLRELFAATSRAGGQVSAFDVVRLYLRVGQADKALAAVRSFDGQPGDDARLRQIVEKYMGPTATPTDAIELASAFVRDSSDRPVAQRICRDAARRFPKAIEPRLCLGEIATQRDQVLVAVQAFEAAIQLAPEKREAWEQLARLHQIHLAQLVSDDKTDELEATLHKVEEFHQAAQRRFPRDPLKINLAGAFIEVGRGYYNAGRVEDAVSFLKRSIAVEPTLFALEQLAVIEVKRGNGAAALTYYQRADALTRGGDHQQDVYWRAKLRRGVADAYELTGDYRAAASARRQSVEGWASLLVSHRQQLPPEERAEFELELGKTLYLLGERDKAITAFEGAIDAEPDRAATYADVMAFLVPRGEREEAVDAYHRALGRAEVSEYLKVYCSLWILDLDRRAGQPEDPLATAFLASVDGDKWYHELARWATGRESDGELEAHAQSQSHRAEAWFYQSLRRLENGNLSDAQALWRKVLATQMMAFFEFDMASFYLRNGASATPTKVVPIPDGSI